MDEPLSNLDAAARSDPHPDRILQRRLGVTTVCVMSPRPTKTEALTMGDRIAVLKDGVRCAGRNAP
jgi:ABC-type sugar transport system ATPase subunit